MGVISLQNQAIKQFQGVHLYHSDFCDCCDLVRIVLAANQVPWVSHYLDVMQGDHLTADFFKLNPRGLVPVLVHNGIVINDSLDIVRYLDRTFGNADAEPDLLQDEKLLWLGAAAGVRQHISLLSFEFLIKALPFHRDNYVIRSKLHHRQGRQSGFYTDLGNRVRVDYQEVVIALQAVNQALQRLDHTLQVNPYLAGNHFSLADIAWLVQVHRLKILKLQDLHQYVWVEQWYHRLKTHTSVQQGMVAWESRLLYDRFDYYIARRERAGDGINAPVWRQADTCLMVS